MRTSLTLALALALTTGAGLAQSTSTSTVPMPTCAAGDPVVWINAHSKVYHMSGSKYYGNTKAGKYACKSAADAAGAHLDKSEAKGSLRQPKGGLATASPDATASPSLSKHHHKHKASASPSPAPSPAST